MDEVTIEDRRKELRNLLDRIEAHPDKDWKAERERVAVLQSLLASHEKAAQD